jgi:copper chaperone NosL
MKTFFSLISIMMVCANCSVKPEPLRYSKDNCSFCKMTLVDDKFGGELVTKKGKVFKFDDIKCMISFLNSVDGKVDSYSYELVVDYAHTTDEFDLIPAGDAFYLQSPEVKSPMAGNVAAFKLKAEQQNHQQKWDASAILWSEVKEIFK